MKKLWILIAVLGITMSSYAEPLVYVNVEETLNLRMKPNTKSKIVEKLPDGEPVYIIGKTKNRFSIEGVGTHFWYKVKTRKGIMGWVFGVYLSRKRPVVNKKETTEPLTMSVDDYVRAMILVESASDSEKKQALANFLNKNGYALTDYSKFIQALASSKELSEKVKAHFMKYKENLKSYDIKISNVEDEKQQYTLQNLYGVWSVSTQSVNSEGLMETTPLYYISFGQPENGVGEVRIGNVEYDIEVFKLKLNSEITHEIAKGIDYIGSYLIIGTKKLSITAKSIGKKDVTHFTIYDIEWLSDTKIAGVLSSSGIVVTLKKVK